MSADKKTRIASTRRSQPRFSCGYPVACISYRFPNDDRQIYVIGVDDWPIIERLEKEGQVTFENDIARERWGKYLSRILPDTPQT